MKRYFVDITPGLLIARTSELIEYPFKINPFKFTHNKPWTMLYLYNVLLSFHEVKAWNTWRLWRAEINALIYILNDRDVCTGKRIVHVCHESHGGISKYFVYTRTLYSQERTLLNQVFFRHQIDCIFYKMPPDCSTCHGTCELFRIF
jgi:hypothetical protein